MDDGLIRGVIEGGYIYMVQAVEDSVAFSLRVTYKRVVVYIYQSRNCHLIAPGPVSLN